MTVIYGLVDPRTNGIRFIGSTRQPLERKLALHLSECKRHEGSCNDWISSLQKGHLCPQIVELEQVNASWHEAEDFWIAYFNFLGNSQVNPVGYRIGKKS